MTAGHRLRRDSIDILVVCTGNQCRSPVAEALLMRRLQGVGVAAAVSSAGLAPAGQPVPEPGVRLMWERGIDLSQHRSRRVSGDMVHHADLVIGMAAAHAREVVSAYPSTFEKTFVLKDLVQRGAAVAPPGGEDMHNWLRSVGSGRRLEDLLAPVTQFDIVDPIGRPDRVWRTVIDDIDAAVSRLAVLLSRNRPS